MPNLKAGKETYKLGHAMSPRTMAMLFAVSLASACASPSDDSWTGPFGDEGIATTGDSPADMAGGPGGGPATSSPGGGPGGGPAASSPGGGPGTSSPGGGPGGGPGTGDDDDGPTIIPSDPGEPPDLSGWPTSNACSWDGSFLPDALVDGLFDDQYGADHTPPLPDGEWDYSEGGATHELANWTNFSRNLGTFSPLMNGSTQCGWQFVGNTNPTDYQGAAAYYHGSSGADLLNLGSGGQIHSFGDGNLGDGPDVLVFDRSYSLDFRTGSDTRGATHDNDLVMAGCTEKGSEFGIITTTIHTGPGHDRVFVRDFSRAGIDLGNGQSGRTDAVDPSDGDDLAVLHGNTHDFRIVGGNGDDTVVWFVDENQQTETWLGPNFFGNGAWGDAVWNGDGTDRLVLAVSPDTQVVTSTPTPNGGLFVTGTSGELADDPPTADDVYAHYCVECPGGGDRKTVILEYKSPDGSVFTGYFYVTAFEELQLGVGEGARVFRIDDAAGRLVEDSSLAAYTPPSTPTWLCE